MNAATVSFEDWMQGRARRRALAVSLLRGPVARRASTDDAVLRSFDGKRECDFPSLARLRTYETPAIVRALIRG